MKINASAIFILGIVFSSFSGFADVKPNKESIVVLSTKREVFYFKAEKKFIGATIEVYDSCNKLIGTEVVYARRMLIDFFYLPADAYVIKIKKENNVLQFQYIKE